MAEGEKELKIDEGVTVLRFRDERMASLTQKDDFFGDEVIGQAGMENQEANVSASRVAEICLQEVFRTMGTNVAKFTFGGGAEANRVENRFSYDQEVADVLARMASMASASYALSPNGRHRGEIGATQCRLSFPQSLSDIADYVPLVVHDAATGLEFSEYPKDRDEAPQDAEDCGRLDHGWSNFDNCDDPWWEDDKS